VKPRTVLELHAAEAAELARLRLRLASTREQLGDALARATLYRRAAALLAGLLLGHIVATLVAQ